MANSKRIIATAIAGVLLLGASAAGVRAGSRAKPEPPRPAGASDAGALASLQGNMAEARRQLSEMRGMLARSSAAPESQAFPDSVAVTGRGRVFGTPNVMTVNLGVVARRATVGLAMSAANRSMSKMIASLKANGVKAEDIQTSSVSVYETYDKPPAEKYEASNGITVKLRAIRRAGEIIQEAMDAAGNTARIHGVSFDLEENTRFLAAARRAAMAEAKDKADEYARYAGRSLGKALYISEVASPNPAPVQFGSPGTPAPAMSRSVPVESGQQDVAVTVTVVFALA